MEGFRRVTQLEQGIGASAVIALLIYLDTEFMMRA